MADDATLSDKLQEIDLNNTPPSNDTPTPATLEEPPSAYATILSSPAMQQLELEEPEHPGQALDEREEEEEETKAGQVIEVSSLAGQEDEDAGEVNAHGHDMHNDSFQSESLDDVPVSEEIEPVQEEEEEASTSPAESPALSAADTTSTAPTTEPSSSTPKLPSVQESPSIPQTETPTSPTINQNRKGPSVLQKTVSMTRQRDLPPKGKDEEKKHLRELESMRTASKEAEKRRQATLEARSQARAAILASALPTWETSILPNWHAVLHDNAEGKKLKKLWWDGTMPVRWRGRLASLTIGNGLAIGKGNFASTLERAKKGIEEGRYPQQTMQLIMDDVEGTLPLLKLFHKGGGVMHDDLVDLLLAYSIFEGQPSYVGFSFLRLCSRLEANNEFSSPPQSRGVAYPAALLLLNLPPAEAYISLINLIKKSCLKSFYSQDTEEIDAYHRIFDTILADYMPKVYANFSHEVVRPSLYLDPWLKTLFIHFLPLDLATRIFDVFLLEGDSFLFRVALVILQILEPRLFNPVLSELDAVFKGEDKGAVAIVRREKDWGDDQPIEVEEVYTEMGATEEVVFRLLEELDWKEETWNRLVSRELPEAD